MAMRRLISCAAAAVCACAHANKVPDGAPVFLELESAHYVLFTDLREADARETIGRLENVRGALIQGSWHGDLSPSEKLRVVELASSTELHEFASSAMTAFYQPIDLFGEPMLVMSTDQGPAENVVLKHELAHALHGSFLPRSPRWLFEGLACYLETLRYDAAADQYVVGEPNADRLHFLQLHPETDFRRALSVSTREAVLLGGQEGYAFQSAAWLVVFYLANERGTGLDGYIHRLALGQEAQAAFTAASGGLSLDALAGEVERYQTRMRHDGESATPRLQYRIREVRLPPWNGEVHARRVPAADVEGLRSELFFLSPGIPRDRAHLGKARDAAARSHPAARARGRDGPAGGLRRPAVARADPRGREPAPGRLPPAHAPGPCRRTRSPRRASRRAGQGGRARSRERDRAQRARLPRRDARPRAAGDPPRSEGGRARSRPCRGARHAGDGPGPLFALRRGDSRRGARRRARGGARQRRAAEAVARPARRDARRLRRRAAGRGVTHHGALPSGVGR